MRELISFSLNGCATNVRTLVKNKTAHALSSSNHWSVTENNSNNTWNVNFGSGNTNNNNKYNSFVGRAVSALGEEELVSWIEASDDCCRNKKTSKQCTEYRIRMEEILPLLALSVKERTYQPQASECFVVKYPKLREIFAAHFLDRIVQHWITLRIEPLLEDLFVRTGDVSFNCRKGYGTLRAVNTFSTEALRVTDGWTKDAYIGKFDVRSFFMSIDKYRLWDMLENFISDNYHGADKETLLWLGEKTVKHRPQDNCIRKGDVSLWDKLPPHKSLFTMDGMAIGNITSQLLANFYLNDYDTWAYTFCKERGGWYQRFVDDMVVILPNKEDVCLFRDKSIRILDGELGLKLHPDKVYIQHAKNGVKFIGSVVKPNRIYLSNRTVGRMYDVLQDMKNLCSKLDAKNIRIKDSFELEHYVCACNSYMGFLKYNQSYALRRRIFGSLPHIWKYVYVTGKYNKVVLKKKYRPVSKLNCRTLNKNGYGNQIFKRNACQNRRRRCKKNAQLQHP